MAVGNLLWKRGTKKAVRRLGPGASAFAGVFSRTQLDGLPAPVIRYFELALTPGQRLIRSARLEHKGKFRGGRDEPWSPFTSVQHFSVHPPGFVWDASIHLAPLLTVRVRDSYIGGTGGMHGRIASLIPVVDQSGGAALNAGALHRLLAEMAWLPTALLPGRGVTCDGMRVPAEGEVEWILPEGRLSYWRGRIVRSEYDFG